MKDLSLEYLDSLKADYENDKVAKAVRRALYKTDVLDLAKKQEAEQIEKLRKKNKFFIKTE